MLNESQEKSIQKMITDQMPEQLKLDYALWPRKAVKELVERELGVVLEVNAVGDYLRKWGFTPQKPKKMSYGQCSEKVQEWLDEEYPEIKAAAEIYWGDEAGAENQRNHGRSYDPKGKTPVKKSMSKRFPVNMVSAITNQGKVQFMIYSGNMNADKFIEFMGQLIEPGTRKVYFIVDSLRVRHSKIVKGRVEENKEKIALFFIPSYSPERDPDEYLNGDLKQGLSAKKLPENKKILQQNVQNHRDMLSENPNGTVKYFKHQSIEYAA